MSSELKHTAEVSKLVAKLSVAGLLEDVTAFIESLKEDVSRSHLFLEVANEVIDSEVIVRKPNENMLLESRENTLKLGVSDRELIKTHIRAFKNELKALIKQGGTGKKVAEKLGTSAANLSRMLNRNSVPHHKTLVDIFKVLEIEYVEIESRRSNL